MSKEGTETTRTSGVINATETGAALMQFMKKVSSKEMLSIFVKQDILEAEDLDMDYSILIHELDDNAVAYVLARMVDQLSPSILEELYVVEGHFENLPHTWIMLIDMDNIIIDPTLAQFASNVPDIAIVDSSINSGYDWDTRNMMFASEWLMEKSGVSVTSMPTTEDVTVVDALEDEKQKPKFKYEIGSGSYAFQNPIGGFELMSLVLEEMDMDLDNAEVNKSMEAIDIQDRKIALDGAIGELTSLRDLQDAKRDRIPF